MQKLEKNIYLRKEEEKFGSWYYQIRTPKGNTMDKESY